VLALPSDSTQTLLNMNIPNGITSDKVNLNDLAEINKNIQALQASLYCGQYLVRGNKWTGIDNKLVILVCYRKPENVTPSKPPTFLRDQTNGRYLSSVYGNEFEVDGIRYQIDRIGEGEIQIRALRVVKKRNGWGAK